MLQVEVQRWRLFASRGGLAVSLAIPTGCTARAVGQGDGEPSGTEASSIGGNDDGIGSNGSDDDLDEYTPSFDDHGIWDDGGGVPGCEAYGCDFGSVCAEGECVEVLEVPGCDDLALSPVPIPALDGALDLTFADVDGDGRDEAIGLFEDHLIVVQHQLDATLSSRTDDARMSQGPQRIVGGRLASTDTSDAVAVVADTRIAWYALAFNSTLSLGGIEDTSVVNAGGVVMSQGGQLTGPPAFVWSESGPGGSFVGSGASGPLALVGHFIAAATYTTFEIGTGQTWPVLIADVTGDEPELVANVFAVTASEEMPVAERFAGLAVGIDDVAPEMAVLVTTMVTPGSSWEQPWAVIHRVDAAAQRGTPFVRVNADVSKAVFGDLDGDDLPDVGLATATGVGAVIEQDILSSHVGCSLWSDLGGRVETISAGDLDGDGTEELLVSVGPAAAAHLVRAL